MLPNFSGTELSEYDFLKLLVSTMVVQGYSAIFDNHELERQLYNFYNDDQYKFLFKDVCLDSYEKEESHIVLDNSFQLAYAMGVLTALSRGKDIRSVISFSSEEAKVNLSFFDKKQVESMDSLCAVMKENLVPSKVAKIYVITKKENDF